jgi:hypothetical protein
MSWPRFAGALVLVGLGALACAPTAEKGTCDEDSECVGRGQTCDEMTATCVVADFDPVSTEEDPPADFTGKVAPFFRGTICRPAEVKSGTTFPVSMQMCVHPCLDMPAAHYNHFFECIGSSCMAYALMYVDANSAAGGCPADVFGQFDESLCQDVGPIEYTVDTSAGPMGEPIAGSMLLEIPYLTNADAQAILDADSSQDVALEHIEQYPQESERVPGERSIWILPHLPEPPASCLDNDACECFDIGF